MRSSSFGGVEMLAFAHLRHMVDAMKIRMVLRLLALTIALFVVQQPAMSAGLQNPDFHQVGAQAHPEAWNFHGAPASVMASQSAPLEMSLPAPWSEAYLSQRLSVPNEWLGRRVRVHIRARPQLRAGGVFPWARVSAQQDEYALTTNSTAALVRGEGDWRDASVELFIPVWADQLTVGIGGTGVGQAQFASIELSVVSPDAALPEKVARAQLDEFKSLVLEQAFDLDQPTFLKRVQMIDTQIQAGVSQFGLDALLGYAVRAAGKGHSSIMPIPKNPQSPGKDELPRVLLEEGGIGRVVVPAVVANQPAQSAQIAYTLSEAILAAQPQVSCGWLVDLRYNSGGNMWPMLEGLGPLFGDGVVGYFRSAKALAAWSFLGGHIRLNDQPIYASGLGHPILHIDHPVAVLISANTASSGEAVAIAFKSRPQTRIFGRKTAGLATSNTSIRLSGGQMLALTTGEVIDSERNSYPAGVLGDERDVADDWQGNEALAKQWLLSSCRR